MGLTTGGWPTELRPPMDWALDVVSYSFITCSPSYGGAAWTERVALYLFHARPPELVERYGRAELVRDVGNNASAPRVQRPPWGRGDIL